LEKGAFFAELGEIEGKELKRGGILRTRGGFSLVRLLVLIMTIGIVVTAFMLFTVSEPDLRISSSVSCSAAV
jgi:hypothetical protein